MHSGLQFGGRPIKFCTQEQAGVFPITLHKELGPQGDGTQGFAGGSGSGLPIYKNRNKSAQEP